MEAHDAAEVDLVDRGVLGDDKNPAAELTIIFERLPAIDDPDSDVWRLTPNAHVMDASRIRGLPQTLRLRIRSRYNCVVRAAV
jgi:hypothetical protein